MTADTDPVPPRDACAVVVRLLWDYLDGELAPDRLAAIEAHLQGCRDCAGHYAFAQRFLHTVRDRWPDATDEDEALRARVVRRLRDEGFHAA